jgi:SagB-type dehydrogenase family enzyme
MTGERYRRSPGLVLYWTARGPACFDTLSTTRSRVSVDIIETLDRLSTWTAVRELIRRDPGLGSPAEVTALLETFVDHGLVQRQSTTSSNWLWQQWSPEAAFFHFGTRDGRYAAAPLEYEAVLRRKAKHAPPPPPTKSMRGRRLALPPVRLHGKLAETLRARRTWRQFGSRPTSIAALASLLHLTFGVQERIMVKGQGRVVLKTSPSGGARHSLEPYLLVLNVRGLARGVYHYDADTHELVDLERALPEGLDRTLANQPWFAEASALVVMTAVFERAMWRYAFSRAYRTVLAEAGHLGQTFCLVATALNLAPFCTMAFRDRELEDLIGVDGVRESAMYVVGVGTKPRGRVVDPGKIVTAG